MPIEHKNSHLKTKVRDSADEARRFWAKVDKRGPDECWPWLASVNNWGYGMFRIGNVLDGATRTESAHRVAYQLLIGPIPDGLQIDHLCRNRACQNPAHMEPVTQRENILRGVSPSAQCAAKTRCPQGHTYSEKNTYVDPAGKRHCRTCARETQKRWCARAREAA